MSVGLHPVLQHENEGKSIDEFIIIISQMRLERGRCPTMTPLIGLIMYYLTTSWDKFSFNNWVEIEHKDVRDGKRKRGRVIMTMKSIRCRRFNYIGYE